MSSFLVLLAVTPLLSFGQMTKQDSLWLPFNSMIGERTVSSEGRLGKGTFIRIYEITLKSIRRKASPLNIRFKGLFLRWKSVISPLVSPGRLTTFSDFQTFVSFPAGALSVAPLNFPILFFSPPAEILSV